MFTQRLSLTNSDASAISSTQLHKLGAVAETADGRIFRYASAGASNLAAGLVNVTPAKTANHTNLAVAAASVNARKVTVTLGATAATQDQYKDGFLAVIDVAGVGNVYRITGNAAIASSGTGDVYLEEGIRVALTSSSKVSLVPSVYGAAIVHPGSSTAFVPNGVASTAVTASNFYWSQTGGLGTVLSDGVVAKGIGAVLTTNAVAGAVITQGTNTTVNQVGFAPEATVDTKYYPLVLTLD